MELKEVFEPLVKFLKSFQKKDKDSASKDMAKERLQLVLMQDRASVSPDFFEMMKKEIIDVIKKYIEIDEESLEVQLTRGFEEGDGTGPALYANIPIKNIKPVVKKVKEKEDEELVTEIVENAETATVIEENVAEESEKGNIEEAMTEEITVNNVETIETNDIEQNKDTQKMEDTVKEKIAEVKDGVAETIEKVKKGAKDGIKKIKTKTQKKKINE